MTNVLISGGAGFIGAKLAAKLASRDYQVTVLDNFSSQIHGRSTNDNDACTDIRLLRGDVRSREDWARALSTQDIVVHFAAETGTGQSMYRIEHYVNVNVLGTANLLEFLANEQHSIRKMLLASSRAVYGEGKYTCIAHGTVYPTSRLEADMLAGDFSIKCPACGREAFVSPTDEDSKLHPSSVYGISKQSQESLFMTVGRAIGIPAVALRYQNVYGPGQSLVNPYTGILSIFSTRIRNDAPISIFEDGKESRDFVYIDDVVEATRIALESDMANYEVFNVGAGIAIDVLSVANMLRSALGGSNDIHVTENFRLGDIRHNLADISKIKARLDFAPRVHFADGIRRFAAWVADRPVPTDRFDESIEEMRRKGIYK